MFQHHRLWHRTFNCDRGRPERAKIVVWVEEPAPPPRLALADGPRISFADAIPGMLVRLTPEGAAPGKDVYNGVIEGKTADAVTVRWGVPADGGPPADADVPTSVTKDWWEKDWKPGYPLGGVTMKSRRAQAVVDGHSQLCVRRREEEREQREEEAAAAAAAQAEDDRRQREEEEEQANQLTLGDTEKQEALTALQKRVQGELRTRQERLRDRLAELEQKLAADTDEAAPAPGKK